jgi:hypothetical protein
MVLRWQNRVEIVLTEIPILLRLMPERGHWSGRDERIYRLTRGEVFLLNNAAYNGNFR